VPRIVEESVIDQLKRGSKVTAGVIDLKYGTGLAREDLTRTYMFCKYTNSSDLFAFMESFCSKKINAIRKLMIDILAPGITSVPLPEASSIDKVNLLDIIQFGAESLLAYRAALVLYYCNYAIRMNRLYILDPLYNNFQRNKRHFRTRYNTHHIISDTQRYLSSLRCTSYELNGADTRKLINDVDMWHLIDGAVKHTTYVYRIDTLSSIQRHFAHDLICKILNRSRDAFDHLEYEHIKETQIDVNDVTNNPLRELDEDLVLDI